MNTLETEVIVTSPESGMGCAIARRFLKEGTAVVCTDIDGDAVVEPAWETKREGGKDI